MLKRLCPLILFVSAVALVAVGLWGYDPRLAMIAIGALILLDLYRGK